MNTVYTSLVLVTRDVNEAEPIYFKYHFVIESIFYCPQKIIPSELEYRINHNLAEIIL